MIANDLISLAKQNGKVAVASKLNVIEEESEYVQEEKTVTEKESEEVLFKEMEEEDSIPLEEESLENIEDIEEIKQMMPEKEKPEEKTPSTFHEDKVSEEILPEDDEEKQLEDPHEEEIIEISKEPSNPPLIEKESIHESPSKQISVSINTTVPTIPAIHEEETKTVEEKNQSFSDSYFDEPEY